MTLIDFQVQGTKVKVTRSTLLLNLVNKIKVEPFKLKLGTCTYTCHDKRKTYILFSRSGVKDQGHIL